MSDLYLHDRTSYCPACGGQNSYFTIIPDSRLIFERDGETHTHHFPEQQDHKCKDCDHEWLMSKPEEA